MVSAAREARYIPGGIREASRRVNRTGRALVEPAKAASRPFSATCWHGLRLYGPEIALAKLFDPIEAVGELAVMGYSNKRGARSTRRHASMDAAIIPL